MEKCKNRCGILLAQYKRKSFCIVKLQGMKSEYILKIPSGKHRGQIHDAINLRSIHIDRKTESLWQRDDDLCLVGPK